jgi:hypothetical protein
MGTVVTEQLLDILRVAPAAVLLLLILWAGHRGWWYWDAGVRRLVDQLERDRDLWRALASALLAKEGIDLPEAFYTLTPDLLAGRRERKADPPPHGSLREGQP